MSIEQRQDLDRSLNTVKQTIRERIESELERSASHFSVSLTIHVKDGKISRMTDGVERSTLIQR